MSTRDSEASAISTLGADQQPPQAARRDGRRAKIIPLVGSVAVLVSILVIWHFAIIVFDVSTFVVPSPMDTVEALRQGLFVNGSYWPELWYTLRNALIGLALGGLFGVLLGTVLAASAMTERILHPFLVAFQTFPKVAIVPILTVWFGFGATPKIIVAAILAFFPLMVNTYTGMLAVLRAEYELMHSLRASRMQIFFKLKLPRAVPAILAGLELAIVYSLLGAVTAEFLGGSDGLGHLSQVRASFLDTPTVFAILVIFGLLGTALYEIVSLVRRRFGYWQ